MSLLKNIQALNSLRKRKASAGFQEHDPLSKPTSSCLGHKDDTQVAGNVNRKSGKENAGESKDFGQISITASGAGKR